MSLEALERVLSEWSAEFRAIQVAAMDAAKDFSWQNSVKQYVAEFKKIGVKAV